MSNLLGVEENPQEQPAECSWGSGDKSVNKRFLRVTNPDTGTRTLLMGEIFFKHLAKHMGYVQRSEVEEEHVRLLQELSDARSDITNFLAELGAVRESVDKFSSIEEKFQRLSDVLEAYDKSPGEDGDLGIDSDDTSGEESEDSADADESDAPEPEFTGNPKPIDSDAPGIPDEGPNTRKTDPNAPGSGRTPEHAGTDVIKLPEDRPRTSQRPSGSSANPEPKSK